MSDRDLPRKCFSCKKRTVVQITERREITKKYDGRSYTFIVTDYPVNRCTNCGAGSVGIEADRAVERALRKAIKNGTNSR